jgi:pimeloyl-ACP methyl ester carboxylesterase
VISKTSPPYQVEGSGPLLIHVAGLDGTGQLFFKQAPRLALAHRVITFRSREHGRFTYEDLTDDLAAIIRNQGEQRGTIVGESFGGTVALNFAMRYPRMVERLVVVNSFPRFRNRLTIKLGAKVASGVPFRLLWPVRRAASAVGLLVDGVDHDDRRLFWRAISTVSSEAYARRLQLIEALDLEPRLSEIQAPTLFIAGDRDLLIPSVKEAYAMAARMPNARVKVIKGAGHACLLGSRVRLDNLLADWDETFL